ncbi:unnamed protein product [Thelazia callipaeda]|uniref:3'-5' exonuclease domain-containing protein n=1 Tax=Thelazia callipaeda TaxID=103827 RepID=A0A0N5D7E3_THECL|nr:unnamed protein product [Thelazia callipaeda]
MASAHLCVVRNVRRRKHVVGMKSLELWIDKVKVNWACNMTCITKCNQCKFTLIHIFDSCVHPLRAILDLYQRCFNYELPELSSLVGFILHHFYIWLQDTSRFDEIYRKLNLDIQSLIHELSLWSGLNRTAVTWRKSIKSIYLIEALFVGTRYDVSHLELIVDIFKLRNDLMVDIIVYIVQEMIETKNYRNAIVCLTVFDMKSHFPIYDVVIPCIWRNHLSAVRTFMRNEKSMQLEVARYFDGLICPDEFCDAVDEHNYCLREVDISKNPALKFKGKKMEKLVSRLVDLNNLSFYIVPNFTRCRRQDALKHIAFLYFNEQRVSEEGYFDYVAHALQSDTELQEFYVTFLYRKGRLNDAIRWVVHFGLIKCMPGNLTLHMTSNAITEARVDLARLIIGRADITNVELFPGCPITVIAHAKQLNKLCPIIEQADLIGIDSEWKPLFMCSYEKVALIQVCLRNSCYLIDVITLEKELTEWEWAKFFRVLFCDSKAIKIGFDFVNDMRALRTSFPYLQPLKEMKNLQVFMSEHRFQLLAAEPRFLDSIHAVRSSESDVKSSMFYTSFCDEKRHFRLSDLCNEILGTPLNKKEQLGNWAMRPLRRDQMLYAAMDGYCLLRLYDKIKTKAQKLRNIKWTRHYREADCTLMVPKEYVNAKKERTRVDDAEFKKMIETPFTENIFPSRLNTDLGSSKLKRRPKDLKVVVDAMMYTLGKNLRRCGIDTVFATKQSDLVEWTQNDPERYALTCWQPEFDPDKIGFGRNVLPLPCTLGANVIGELEYVLKWLYVVLSEEDLYSRCMQCNANCLVIAPSPVLEAMYQTHIAPPNFSYDRICHASDYSEIENVETFFLTQAIDPKLYFGYGCKLEVNEIEREVLVHCHNGSLDIENCLVSCNRSVLPVLVKISEVPFEILSKRGRNETKSFTYVVYAGTLLGRNDELSSH